MITSTQISLGTRPFGFGTSFRRTSNLILPGEGDFEATIPVDDEDIFIVIDPTEFGLTIIWGEFTFVGSDAFATDCTLSVIWSVGLGTNVTTFDDVGDVIDAVPPPLVPPTPKYSCSELIPLGAVIAINTIDIPSEFGGGGGTGTLHYKLHYRRSF